MALFQSTAKSQIESKDGSRLSWVMVLRVVIISVLLGATIAMNRDTDAISGASTRFLLSLIVFTYVLTIGYSIWYRIGKRLLLLGYIQFATDALLFSALSYSTGGVVSGFTFLFHLWVIVAVVSLGKRAGYIQATISAMLLGLIVALVEFQVVEFLSDVSPPPTTLAVAMYSLSVNVVSLYIVASLVNILAVRLEFAGAGLAQERAQKEVLAQKLEHAKRLAALGELAATLAHEIRNPLSAVSGSFQMLQSAAQLSEEDKTLINIIDRELGRMGRLVDDILEFARPRQPALQDLNLSKLCAETLRSFKMGVKLRGISVGKKIQPGIRCRGDSNQIRQVLWNLLVNASHVVQDETGEIELRVHAVDGESYVEVADNGPGVSPEIREKVFDAFFSTKERGMGLGLALCHRILESHEGRVELVKNTSPGATFRLIFPRTPSK